MDHSKQSLLLLGVVTFATLWAPIKTDSEMTTSEYDYNTYSEDLIELSNDDKTIPSVASQSSQETSEKTMAGTEKGNTMTQGISQNTSANAEQTSIPTIGLITARTDSGITTRSHLYSTFHVSRISRSTETASKAEHPTVQIIKGDKDQSRSLDNTANLQNKGCKQNMLICLIIIGVLILLCTLLLVTTVVLCNQVHTLKKYRKKPQTRSNGDFVKSSKLWSTGPSAVIAMSMEEAGTSATSEEVTPLKDVEEEKTNEISGNTANVENGNDQSKL